MIKLSKQQSDIVAFFPTLLNDSKINSIAIKAFAGCGKSFILKYLVKEFSDKDFLGLAFNSSIVAENKSSFPKRNSKWFTLHKLAREYLQKFGVNIDFKNARGEYKNLEVLEILNLDQSMYQFGDDIKNVFKVYCQSDLKRIDSKGILSAAKAQKMKDVLDINQKSLKMVIEKAIELWDKSEKGIIAPTFDFYLKYFEVKEFAKRITEFDVVELDEAQDSNSVTISIISQIPAKRIFVGDEHQSIYGFRGTVNALEFADKTFYLSTTYRYIPDIATYATKILKGYKLERVPISSFAKLGNYTKGSGVIAYLSRNNSSMIALIDEFIKNDKEFITAKKPKEFFAAAIAVLKIRLNRKITVKGFEYLNKFQDIEGIEDYIEETNDREIKTAYKIQKRYGKRIFVLLRKANNYYRLKNKKKFNCVFSTAHTSKGLEWDEVVLMKDFPDLHKMLKDKKINSAKQLMDMYKEGDYSAHEIIQEINLFYVAVTRAKYYFE